MWWWWWWWQWWLNLANKPDRAVNTLEIRRKGDDVTLLKEDLYKCRQKKKQWIWWENFPWGSLSDNHTCAVGSPWMNGLSSFSGVKVLIGLSFGSSTWGKELSLVLFYWHTNIKHKILIYDLLSRVFLENGRQSLSRLSRAQPTMWILSDRIFFFSLFFIVTYNVSQFPQDWRFYSALNKIK